jgi:SP family general alpha glucoside:H+ symporter-like MFS transporter
LLVLIGGLHYASSHAGLIVTAMIFNIAISTAQITSNAPVYALSVEVSSVRLRSKTQSLGFMAYYIMGWIFLFTVPYMFQVAPEGAGWGVRTCWLFAGLTFGFVIFCYFFVGETKGKSYADIDELYHRGISPRKFKETEVHAERSAVA